MILFDFPSSKSLQDLRLPLAQAQIGRSLAGAGYRARKRRSPAGRGGGNSQRARILRRNVDSTGQHQAQRADQYSLDDSLGIYPIAP
jgi:hypothetical protein